MPGRHELPVSAVQEKRRTLIRVCSRRDEGEYPLVALQAEAAV